MGGGGNFGVLYKNTSDSMGSEDNKCRDHSEDVGKSLSVLIFLKELGRRRDAQDMSGSQNLKK